MEKINTEVLVSSLFNIGFDRVDSALFTYTLAKLSIDDRGEHFVFEDQKTSQTFDKYVDYNGFLFKLNEGLSIDTNVSDVEGFVIPLGKKLVTNRYLIEYLTNLDFSDIVLKKMELYGIKSIEDVDINVFSKKEIEILKKILINQDRESKKLELVK